MIGVLAYLASASILVTYYLTTRDSGWVAWFNWANALGGIPLLVVSLEARVYQNAMITLAFCSIGWIGVLTRSGKQAKISS